MKKDFISYNVRLTTDYTKKTLFSINFLLTDSFEILHLCLKGAYEEHINTNLKYFEYNTIFLQPHNIKNKTDDNIIFADENITNSFFKKIDINGEFIRYAFFHDSQRFQNNDLPNWNILSKKYNITFELIFDEVGYKKALSKGAKYKNEKFDSESELRLFYEKEYCNNNSLYM